MRCRNFSAGVNAAERRLWNRYSSFQDRCLVHPAYGAAVVPKARWQLAQKAEATVMNDAPPAKEEGWQQALLDKFHYGPGACSKAVCGGVLLTLCTHTPTA